MVDDFNIFYQEDNSNNAELVCYVFASSGVSCPIEQFTKCKAAEKEVVELHK